MDELFIYFIGKVSNAMILTYCHDIVSKLNKKVVMSLIYRNYHVTFFLIYSDNDDMKSSKRHVTSLTLIFLIKCFSKSCNHVT